mmetsp:Transcript_30689/g.60064  ORF Transcript_30689/g.60064 Transcript_30689/m.60064 type:complete len:95 (+) Transcript_30689:412-696(+)
MFAKEDVSPKEAFKRSGFNPSTNAFTVANPRMTKGSLDVTNLAISPKRPSCASSGDSREPSSPGVSGISGARFSVKLKMGTPPVAKDDVSVRLA